MLVEHLNWRVLDAEISNVGLGVLVIKVCPILEEVDRVVRKVVLLAYQLVRSILEQLLSVAL